MKTPSEKPIDPVVGLDDENLHDDLAGPGSLPDDLLFIPVGCTSRPPPGPYRSPCDVQCAEDLPQRLFLGSLVPGLFRADGTGWRARYEDIVPGTSVELQYTASKQTLHGRFVWNGLEGLSVFAEGHKWPPFIHQMALPLPKVWTQRLSAQLRLVSNVRCSFDSDGKPTISAFPDGALMTLIFPVPMSRLRALPVCLERIDADVGIKTPIVMTAALARATVATCRTPHPEGGNHENRHGPSGGCGPALTEGWIYLAHITCFFRDLTRVVFCCQQSGFIGSPDFDPGVTSYPNGAIWAAAVHPANGPARGYSFVTSDGRYSWHVSYRECQPSDSTDGLMAARGVARSEAADKLKAVDTFFRHHSDAWQGVEDPSYRNETMADFDEESWALAGSGELGDRVFWEKEFASVADVKSNLWLLEEIGQDAVDITTLLSGLKHLQVLAELDFPPLYSERDFDWIDGFITFEDDTFEGGPGMSFNSIRIYVERDKQAELLQEFRLLNERLESLAQAHGLF